jgi:hypothetical protein
VVALATEVPGAGGTPQGTVGTEMAGADVSRSVALGDTAPAHGSMGGMSLVLLRLYLLVSPASAPLPIN